jgi:disulfide oxidoreductase YuzD
MYFLTDFDKQSTEADKKMVENIVESAKYLMPHMSVEDEENIRVKTILHLLEAKLENIYGVPVYLNVQVGDEKLEL